MKTTAGDLTSRLVGNIWNGYLRRVPYARKYKQLVESGEENWFSTIWHSGP